MPSPISNTPLAEQDPYPTAPMFNRTEDFANFDFDTLCFVFYFQPGTREQIKAALELKRRQWFFSKKYKTWFKKQRNAEEKKKMEVSGVRKEVGAYIYFDHDEGNWCKRIKDQLEMDYALVENELVLPHSLERED